MTRLAEIGQELKAARESRKRSLADIATETHLKLNHLQALEEGDESRLPEPIYVKSFIRKYAQAVGLPADELANRYWETRPLPPPPPQTRELNVPWWVYPVLLTVVLFTVVGVLAYLTSRPAPETAPSPAITAAPTPAPTPASPSVPVQAPVATGMATDSLVATGAVGLASPSPTPTVRPTPSPRPTATPRPTPRPTVRPTVRPTATPAAADTLPTTPATVSTEPEGNNPESTAVLRLHATGTSWVQIARGGRVIYENTMGPGQTMQWPILEGLSVVIGNGAAVEVTAGEERLGTLGGKNQVVRRVFK